MAEMNAGWEAEVIKAILPQMHEIARDVDTGITADAPRRTGTLASATHADVDDLTGEILVSVDPDVVNPETKQRVGEYAKYVIQGTSEQHANDYIGRATAAALQKLRSSR